MTHDTPLATHVAIYKRVRETIAAEFGLDQDDEAVLDTAAGETDLEDVLVRILKAARKAEFEARGIEEYRKELATVKAEQEDRAARLRKLAEKAMRDAGLPKIKAPGLLAYTHLAQRPLEVPDPEAVPDEFCRIKREPDKLKIGAALKEANAEGRAFNFAYFGEAPETLTVRSK